MKEEGLEMIGVGDVWGGSVRGGSLLDVWVPCSILYKSFSFLLLYLWGSERKVWIILRVLGCSVMGGLSRQRDLFYSILFYSSSSAGL